MKKLTISLLFAFTALVLYSQEKTVEQVVADTACACLSKLDANLPKEKLAAQADNCMLQAIQKNNGLIEESYSFQDDNAYQDGVKAGQAIAQKVFVILAKECDKYHPIFIKLSKKD